MANTLIDMAAVLGLENGEKEDKRAAVKSSKWLTSDFLNFMPCPQTVDKLKPGYYDVYPTNSGIVFRLNDLKLDDIIRFQDSPSLQVVEEIQAFWNKGQKFAEHGLSHKRGILLHGPAGSGKSSTIQLVVNDVVKMGGVAIRFTTASVFKAGLDALREIQPVTPVVVVMEDIESILAHDNKSKVLNVLDGVDGLDKVVFLASTNYPDMLEARIISRPSRFDRRYEIAHPSARARAEFLVFVAKQCAAAIDVERWVKDTEGFSIAHLKELFVAYHILDTPYDGEQGALAILKKMVETKVKAVHERSENSVMGFGGK